MNIENLLNPIFENIYSIDPNISNEIINNGKWFETLFRMFDDIYNIKLQQFKNDYTSECEKIMNDNDLSDETKAKSLFDTYIHIYIKIYNIFTNYYTLSMENPENIYYNPSIDYSKKKINNLVEPLKYEKKNKIYDNPKDYYESFKVNEGINNEDYILYRIKTEIDIGKLLYEIYELYDAYNTNASEPKANISQKFVVKLINQTDDNATNLIYLLEHFKVNDDILPEIFSINNFFNDAALFNHIMKNSIIKNKSIVKHYLKQINKIQENPYNTFKDILVKFKSVLTLNDLIEITEDGDSKYRALQNFLEYYVPLPIEYVLHYINFIIEVEHIKLSNNTNHPYNNSLFFLLSYNQPINHKLIKINGVADLLTWDAILSSNKAISSESIKEYINDVEILDKITSIKKIKIENVTKDVLNIILTKNIEKLLDWDYISSSFLYVDLNFIKEFEDKLNYPLLINNKSFLTFITNFIEQILIGKINFNTYDSFIKLLIKNNQNNFVEEKIKSYLDVKCLLHNKSVNIFEICKDCLNICTSNNKKDKDFIITLLEKTLQHVQNEYNNNACALCLSGFVDDTELIESNEDYFDGRYSLFLDKYNKDKEYKAFIDNIQVDKKYVDYVINFDNIFIKEFLSQKETEEDKYNLILNIIKYIILTSIKLPNCSHVFHKICLAQYIKSSNSIKINCPSCRTESSVNLNII